MASFTKDELRTLLTNNGIELPASSAKKEDLVALYEKFVEPIERSKGEFSSDDEEISFSPTKRTSKRGSGSSQKASSDKSQIILEEIISEVGVENGSSEEDISKLSDDELAARLREHGVVVGPIVESTRALYEKKLSKLIGSGINTTVNESIANGSNTSENSSAAPENGTPIRNGEFSADEEVTEEEDESQPSLVIKKAPTPLRRTPRSTAKAKETHTSPIKEIGASLRQRFAGGSDESDGRVGGRFTPTPRRSIHSYKVTETTTQTMVKSPDGNIAHDFLYKKETSETKQEIGGMSRVFKVLPKIFFLLILAAVAYYVYTTYTPSVDQPIETSAPAQPESAPEQPSIANI